MDVETILQQIRERVIAEEDGPVISRAQAFGAAPNGSGPHSSVNESLTRATAYLVVTGRAWDRLPPVSSNRSGTFARFELWIKRTCKPLTRWFTWEQVNFNRSVNDALGDVIEILKVEAQELASVRAQLTNEMHREFVTLRSEIEASGARLQSEIEASGAGLRSDIEGSDARLRSDIEASDARLRSEIEAAGAHLNETNAALARLSEMFGSLAEETRGTHSQLADKLNELAAALRTEQQMGKSAQDQELNRRLAELAAEFREDQRVCFRQLSLETSESAVLEDRGRRELLARLERLETFVSQKRR